MRDTVNQRMSNATRELAVLWMSVGFLISTAATPALAQGVESEETTNAIVGTEIQEEQATSTADLAKVIAAIEKTPEAISAVRKTSELKKVEIVYLADAATAEGGPPPEIAEKIKQREAEVTELRKELEGSAMLFHAIDSRRILVQDVLAVSFDAPDSVTIYAAGKPPA